MGRVVMLRSLSILLVVLGAAACPGAVGDETAAVDPGAPDNANPGSRGCVDDLDCVPAAKTCCECPTFATSVSDPKLDACSDVDCPPMMGTCSRVRAVCEENLCELRCEPAAVTKTCVDGFAADAAGCLIDACAQPANECAQDTDCVRTRADCCGCTRGGSDTAVAKADQLFFDASLGCSGTEQCPGVNTCSPETAQCAQGSCKLIAGDLPPDACGRPDLPACPAGRTCTVNASKTADLHGVGVCR